MSEKPVDINKLSYEEVKDLLNGLDGAKNQNLEKIKSEAKEESVFYNPSNYGSYKKALETNLEKCVAFYEKVRKLLNEAIEKLYRKDENGFPVDKNFLSMLNVIDENPVGYYGAKIVQAPDGTKFVMKRASHKDEAEYLNNEYAANQFYRDMGVNVPDIKMINIEKGKEYALLSKVLDGGKSLDEWLEENKDKPEKIRSMQKKLRKDFAVDVLLGNWDVVRKNTNNILVDSNDEPCRMNVGCALGFNSKGERKDENSWNRTVGWNKNEEWKKSAYFDDIWIMTGNEKRIGLSVDGNIPNYFGDCDVFEIAEEINSKDWAKALQLLSEKDQWAIKLRLEEARQLFERGNRYVKIEDMSVFPRETMLNVLDYTYKMSKDGFRYAVGTQKIKDVDEKYIALRRWFVDPDLYCKKWEKISREFYSLRGKKFYSCNDYLSFFIGNKEWDIIQLYNESQGNGSYTENSCRRKICILYNKGFRLNETKNINHYIRKLEDRGYFVGDDYRPRYSGVSKKEVFLKAAEYFKSNPQELKKRSDSILKYDSAIQLILENSNIDVVWTDKKTGKRLDGIDKKTGTIVLARTEHKDVVNSLERGDVTNHRRGVCESHSHIRQYCANGYALTVTRVPFSRIHGLWFMERKSHGNKNVHSKYCMFKSLQENEILADTNNIPVIFAGKATKGKDISGAVKVLKLFEVEHEKNLF